MSSEHSPRKSHSRKKSSSNSLNSDEAKDELIKLNIGGHIYITTVSTLISRGENFFTALLSGNMTSVKIDDAYFIDRNGFHFAPLLDYLRTGHLFVPPTMRTEAVIDEAAFYLIDLPELNLLAEYPVETKKMFATITKYNKDFILVETENSSFEQKPDKRSLCQIFSDFDEEGYKMLSSAGSEWEIVFVFYKDVEQRSKKKNSFLRENNLI